ncbi:MAG: DUF883 C-terminal domain-containing protein [Acidobacteria bacterium]|nr:DUF883 C-terminal domain-containing protein [Acidobacteriota bacterium]
MEENRETADQNEEPKSRVASFRERAKSVDVGSMTDRVRTYVRESPGKALLISVATGFLIGILLRSDSDDEE